MANPDAIVLASNFWDISRLWQLDPAWMRDTPVFPQDLMASWRANFTTIAQKFKVGAVHLLDSNTEQRPAVCIQRSHLRVRVTQGHMMSAWPEQAKVQQACAQIVLNAHYSTLMCQHRLLHAHRLFLDAHAFFVQDSPETCAREVCAGRGGQRHGGLLPYIRAYQILAKPGVVAEQSQLRPARALLCTTSSLFGPPIAPQASGLRRPNIICRVLTDVSFAAWHPGRTAQRCREGRGGCQRLPGDRLRADGTDAAHGNVPQGSDASEGGTSARRFAAKSEISQPLTRPLAYAGGRRNVSLACAGVLDGGAPNDVEPILARGREPGQPMNLTPGAGTTILLNCDRIDTQIVSP